VSPQARTPPRAAQSPLRRRRLPFPQPSRRGASWLLSAPETDYADVRSPTSPDAWIAAVTTALATPTGEAYRRRISIKRDTFLAFARAEASTANRRTGRNIATSHDTLARLVGMSKITARRARALMEALGCLVTIRTGRYLFHLERLEAAALHGGKQLRAASLRALNMPVIVGFAQNEHLATASRLHPSTHPLNSYPRRGKPHSEAASRPQHRRKQAKFTPGADQPRSLTLQRLAARLVQGLPWLPDSLSTLRVQRIIYRSGFDADRYTYGDLIRLWAVIDGELDQTPKDAGTVNDPEAYLVVRMKLAVNYVRWHGPSA